MYGFTCGRPCNFYWLYHIRRLTCYTRCDWPIFTHVKKIFTDKTDNTDLSKKRKKSTLLYYWFSFYSVNKLSFLLYLELFMFPIQISNSAPLEPKRRKNVILNLTWYRYLKVRIAQNFSGHFALRSRTACRTATTNALFDPSLSSTLSLSLLRYVGVGR